MENQDMPSAEMAQTSSMEDFSQQKNASLEEKFNSYMAKLKTEQNLPVAILTGLAAALAGGVLWALITVSTGYQIGYMAVAIGFIVGYGMRVTGKGIDKIFGICGAILALFGCVLGNFLSLIGFVASESGMSYLETMSRIDYSLIPELMGETFNPMDLLFYGIAVYEGYKFSFRQVTEEEVQSHVVS